MYKRIFFFTLVLGLAALHALGQPVLPHFFQYEQEQLENETIVTVKTSDEKTIEYVFCPYVTKDGAGFYWVLKNVNCAPSHFSILEEAQECSDERREFDGEECNDDKVVYFFDKDAKDKLVAIALSDASDRVHSYRSYEYDEMGNVIQENLYGKFAGTENATLDVNPEGILQNSRDEIKKRILHFYNEDTFPIKSIEDNGQLKEMLSSLVLSETLKKRSSV